MSSEIYTVESYYPDDTRNNKWRAVGPGYVGRGHPTMYMARDDARDMNHAHAAGRASRDAEVEELIETIQELRGRLYTILGNTR